jgi:protocatechuate 3,4-dioxygenase, alpha subunit
MDFVPSSSQTIGPFFHVYFNEKGVSARVVSAEAKGDRIHLECRVIDGDGAPISDAMIELWQADAAGIYNHPADPRRSEADPAVAGFGRLPANDDGVCEFETIMPGRVHSWNDALQAPHINVTIFGRGLLKGLSTRIYFAGNSANQDDPVLALVPSDRRDTLMARQNSQEPGHWSIDLRLSGDGETVFFDV